MSEVTTALGGYGHGPGAEVKFPFMVTESDSSFFPIVLGGIVVVLAVGLMFYGAGALLKSDREGKASAYREWLRRVQFTNVSPPLIRGQEQPLFALWAVLQGFMVPAWSVVRQGEPEKLTVTVEGTKIVVHSSVPKTAEESEARHVYESEIRPHRLRPGAAHKYLHWAKSETFVLVGPIPAVLASPYADPFCAAVAAELAMHEAHLAQHVRS